MDNIRALAGERIRTLRKEKGWSQEELGERADLHYTYIGAVERGEKNASIDTLDKIAEALGIEMVDLFAFPQGRPNSDKLRALVIEEVKESSPEVLKLIADLIGAVRGVKAPAPRKNRKHGKK